MQVQSGYAMERSQGPGILDWIFDNQAARRQREALNYVRRTGELVADAMQVTSALAADFVANCLETEYNMEQTVHQYSNSRFAIASAPLYVNLARQMQIQTVPEITQSGMNRIKRKIEQG